MKLIKFGLIICGILLWGRANAECDTTYTVTFSSNGGTTVANVKVDCDSTIMYLLILLLQDIRVHFLLIYYALQ